MNIELVYSTTAPNGLLLTTQCVFGDFNRNGVADSAEMYAHSHDDHYSVKAAKLGAAESPAAAAGSGAFGAGIVSGVAGAAILVAGVAIFARGRKAAASAEQDVSEKAPVVGPVVGRYGSI